MSYDPVCAQMSDELSCRRQHELAKIQADQETAKLRYAILNPGCNRLTQLANREDEHKLQLGRQGNHMNNAFSRALPNVSILEFPQHCLNYCQYGNAK